MFLNSEVFKVHQQTNQSIDAHEQGWWEVGKVPNKIPFENFNICNGNPTLGNFLNAFGSLQKQPVDLNHKDYERHQETK